MSDQVLVLTRRDVARLLTPDECIAAVEAALRMFGERQVEPPAILSTHVPGGGFHVKTAVLPSDGRLFYAAKTNANFPDNVHTRRLPTIQGALLLFDAECGRPLAVMDSIELTSLRTAAASAVAARYLARHGSTVVTIIGCGVQGRAHLTALLRVLPIGAVYTHDRLSERARELAHVARGLGLEARAVDDFGDATRQSDVVVTCTSATAPFLDVTHVRPGTFVAAVGADAEHKQEIDPRVLAAARVVPDVRHQAATIGELHHALGTGLMAADDVTADLGEIVAGRRPGRTSPEDIIVFDSTGMALEDAAAACAVYRKAVGKPRIRRIRLG